jgi:hypothetical protein
MTTGALHPVTRLGDQWAVDAADIRVLLDWLEQPVTEDGLIAMDAVDDVRGILDGSMCERSVWWASRDYSLDDEEFYAEMLAEGLDVRPRRPGVAM